jgi:hypothetical protein
MSKKKKDEREEREKYFPFLRLLSGSGDRWKGEMGSRESGKEAGEAGSR